MYKKILLSTVLAMSIVSVASTDPFYNDKQVYIPQQQTQVPYEQQYRPGPYISLAYGFTNVEDDYFEYRDLSVHTDIDYDAIMFQAGYEYNPYIALEFRYWTSLNDGDYTVTANQPINPTLPGSYSDFDAFGAYLKPMYPLSKAFSVYGLVGFSSVNVSGEAGWDLLYNEGSFSWGGGASLALTPNMILFVDYVRLFDDKIDDYYYNYDSTQDTTVDTLNFGISYKF